jgi:hypothetical protein
MLSLSRLVMMFGDDLWKDQVNNGCDIAVMLHLLSFH